MRMRVAPASSEFSRSSLTTDAGRSTTSPAAILLATFSESTWMRPMKSLSRDQRMVNSLNQNRTHVGQRFTCISPVPENRLGFLFVLHFDLQLPELLLPD